MDNYTTSPGTGGATFASDDVGGVQFPRVKVTWGADGTAVDASAAAPLPVEAQTLRQSYWPGYTGPSDTAPGQVAVDDSGALIARAAVTTDEGTFRVNFANTGYAVGFGSVTVSGRVVTGTGFLNSDVHYRDYFKLAADAETAWVQIASIDSDTQLTLDTAYVGGASGTGQRSLVFPMIGSGGSLTVGSGALTIASGTTTSAITGVKRYTDYSPLVFRARCSISQRIANQETHIGLEEDAATTRWFARFLADGTVNTTLKCETGRNPTGTPSASEIETTTITLPTGLTTATMLDYRVEVLTESVRFYANGLLLAQHVRVIPHQHDPLTSHVEVRNGTAPASTTSVVVDYMTGKNHNKLEIGVMSDAEQIIAAAAPLQQFSYNVAGVIAINTDLIVLDCLQLRSLFIQCNSMGTSGVVTVQWANDAAFAAPITATLLSESGASSTTFNGAVLRVTNVMARYCRLRLTTATTAGTTTINAWGAQTPYIPLAQPVSGTFWQATQPVSMAAGTNLSMDVGLQVRANATGATSIHHIVSAATTNVAQIKASAGRVLGWSLSNTTASWRFVKLHNVASATAGAAVAMTIGIPPNGTVSESHPFGIGFATAISRSIVTGAADADATATAANDVVGDIFWA